MILDDGEGRLMLRCLGSQILKAMMQINVPVNKNIHIQKL